MRAPTIEFMPAQPRWGLLTVWVIACLSLSGYWGYRAWQEREAAQALDRQNLELAQEISRLTEHAETARTAHSGKPPAYLEDALTLAKTAAFPLQQVLRALETTQVTGVKVTSIDIHPDRGTADVVLEFTDHKALFAYLELINQGEPAPRWLLRQATAGMVSAAGQAAISSNW